MGMYVYVHIYTLIGKQISIKKDQPRGLTRTRVANTQKKPGLKRIFSNRNYQSN